MRLVEFFEATVYHGSSHTFRKFNVRKAGTGEGFDAFGYGTYFSEHPDVAKFYSVMGGEPNRNVYTVEIQDDIIDKMLDWDKQLQHQSPYVQERLSSLPEIDPRFGIPREEWFKYMEKGNITGQQVYGGLGLRKKLSKKQVSSVLLKLGIPGIKYLDAVSREDGSEVETRNIVLFDTRYARIMDRKTVTEAVAYHGSPHKFGEFDIQKIGSGQGAQTYGWGLYFAEEPTVAKSYYDELTRTKRGSVLVRGKETNYKDPAVALAIGAMNWGGDPLENLTKITPGKLYTPDVIRKAAKIIKAGKTSYEAPGAVYTVEIPDQVVAQMLSWDHPLSAQKSVVAAIPRTREGHKGLHIFPSKAGDILYLGNEELGQLDALDGRQLMDFLQQVVGPKGASKHLLSMGIPGLKFLDQHSRTKGHGTHNFVMFDDKHVKIVDTVSESHLTEGASPVLYHYTTVTNLEPILQNNEFSMATSYGTGAETPHDVKGAPYYLSTTRHKLGAYHSTGANYSVMLVLDGAALAQRYKIKPVDYWDAGPERSESEDRVFSREQTIPNASKYIKEIHMITEDPDRTSFSSDVVRRMTRRLLINAKKRGVPIYLYRDSKAWLLQDKRKALPISQALDQPEEKAGKRYSSMRTNWFKPWIELYHKRTAEELSPEAARLLRNLRYDDYNGEVTRRLLNTVHNDKRSPNVVALIKLMQQNRLSTVAEYTALIKKKWGITEAVDFERITPIKKQPKFPWGAQIGQTATTQANTYDIGRPGTVIKKIRIENENESIIDFFKLIMRNQDNPFFPRIYNAKMYQNPKAKGLTLIVEMEKLKELTDEMLIDTAPHLLKQIGIEVEREMFDKTWTLALEMMSKMDKPDARASLKKMSKNPKFVEAMNILERGFAQYGSDLHYQNLMVRLTPHGPQLVIIDPFLPGTERYKDDDRE